MQNRVHLPALDGIRCLGFLAVFAHHAGPRGAPWIGGVLGNLWFGVDVFFALSGFLVTWVLLREEERTEQRTGCAKFGLWRFWARRALRIWPLYFVALALFLFVVPHLPAAWSVGPTAGSPAAEELRGTFGLSGATFLLNWSVAAHGWPEGPLGPLWSISVEEQFYVLWPLAMTLLPKGRRKLGIAVAIVGAVLWKLCLMTRGVRYEAHYVSTFARADTFLAGAWLAMQLGSRTRVHASRWVVIGTSALGVLLLLMPQVQHRGVAAGMFGYLALTAFAMGLIWLALDSTSLASRALSSGFAVRLGQISFGLYVFHHGAIEFADRCLGNCGWSDRGAGFFALRAALAFSLSLAAAWASWRYLERPFLRLKDRLV